jgi:hypothetical protein
MIKRFFTREVYQKIGCPDLNNKMYFKKDGKKIWGKVVLVDYYKKRGYILLGLIPFKKKA